MFLSHSLLSGFLLHTPRSSRGSPALPGHGQRRLLRDEPLGVGREVQGWDCGEGAECPRAGGRNHPGGLRLRHLLQGQLAVLGEETGADQSSPLQDGCSLHPHLAAGARHPGERRKKNVKIII